MTLAHRVPLDPTPAQQEYFRRACGVARFAYNWAFAEWQRQYAAREKPSEAALRRRLNALKDEQFPWMRDVTKNAPQQGIENLGRAYAGGRADRAARPTTAMSTRRAISHDTPRWNWEPSIGSTRR
jgi:putative transposase